MWIPEFLMVYKIRAGGKGRVGNVTGGKWPGGNLTGGGRGRGGKSGGKAPGGKTPGGGTAWYRIKRY